MLEYIKGDVVELSPTCAIIENAGLAYNINISLSTYSSIQDKSSVKLYLYEAIREDAFVLYGFSDKKEREMFMLLISVSGVGAGTARMILSTFTVDELQTAIMAGDERSIKSVKGVGLKTAGRIIIDLKDKMAALGADLSVSGKTATAEASSEVCSQAESALVMLGFVPSAVRKTVAALHKDYPAASVEEYIKMALKLL